MPGWRRFTRYRRYRPDDDATAAPAIPAETSVAKDPTTPDGQVSLALWPAQDPNLHKLGIYKFRIEASQLEHALWATELPRRESEFFTFELSTSELKIISATNDASFMISPSAPLLEQAEIGETIRFKVGRHAMKSIRCMAGPLAFTFNRHSSLLKWISWDDIYERVKFDFHIKARWVPLTSPEDGPRPLAVLDPQPLVTGIRYASTLIRGKSPPNFEGLQIEGGSIFGACFTVFSRYRSPLLPKGLALNIPKVHVANALALFRKLDGQVEVLETDSRVYVRAQNIEGSWTRMDSWSPSHILAVNRPFKSSPLRTVVIETPLLQKATDAMAGHFEKVRVTVDDHGADAHLALSGSSKAVRGRIILPGKLVSNGVENQRPWDFTINAKDLRDATVGTHTRHTLLSVCDRGLLIQSEEFEGEFETFLMGCERQ